MLRILFFFIFTEILLSCNHSNSIKTENFSNDSIRENYQQLSSEIALSLGAVSQQDTAQYKEYLSRLRCIISHDSSNFNYYSTMSILYIRLGELDSAIFVLDKAFCLNPEFSQSLVIQSLIFYKKKNLKEFESKIGEAIIVLDKRIARTNSIDDKLARASNYLLIDKSRAYSELERLENEYPGNKKIEIVRKHSFETFNIDELVENTIY